MKLKVDCDSPLLQESLEIFLKEFLDEKGKVISDNPKKGDIIIGRDIKKPFTKTSLLIQLEKLTEKSFEEKFDEIFDEFKEKLKNLIKEYINVNEKK